MIWRVIRKQRLENFNPYIFKKAKSHEHPRTVEKDKFMGVSIDTRISTLKPPTYKGLPKRASGVLLASVYGLPLKRVPKVTLPNYLNWAHSYDSKTGLPEGREGSSSNSILTLPRDQGGCGSCWAFAITGMLADRISILTKGEIKKPLSTQWVIDCVCDGDYSKRCCGGALSIVIKELGRVKVPPEEDYPYSSSRGGSCSCQPGLKVCSKDFEDYYRFNPNESLGVITESMGWNGNWSNIPEIPDDVMSENIRRIKTEIILNGPVVSNIIIYPSLYDYSPMCVECHSIRGVCECTDKVKREDKTCLNCVPDFEGQRCVCTLGDGTVAIRELDSAIYIHGSDEVPEGGHAVEIVGWSDPYTDPEGNKQVGYWVVKNSWGVGYGLNGYVLFPMGVNECAIETLVLSGTPDMTVPTLKDFSH